jgi:molybdate transport system substrate-binding protein
MKPLRWFTLFGLFLAVALARAEVINVAVSGNFMVPMQKIAAEFEKETGHKAVLSFGTVGKFYAQIHNGAPFDVFVAADQDTPIRLINDGLAEGDTRYTYAIGKLVLWSTRPGLVDAWGEVLRNGNFKRLAIANPRLAVYGAAAIEVMNAMNVLQNLEAKFASAENINQAWQFVATGSADLGFVALSQVIGDDGKIKPGGSHWLVPQNLYTPIHQDVVVLRRGKDKPAAHALAAYLKSDKAKAIIRAYGYVLDTAG